MKVFTFVTFCLRAAIRPALITAAAVLGTAAAFLSLPQKTNAAPPSRVAYSVTVGDPADETFHVTAKASDVSGPSVSFAIAAWSPGWYVLTHAYENIHNVSARDENGGALAVTHGDKLTWQVANPSGAKTITLSYEVDGREPPGDKENGPADLEGDYGFFAPSLSKTNGYVPGPATLMYVVDGKTAPCSVTYHVPTGWKIASANDPTGDPATFTAPDYDTLADQPADLGTFQRVDRTVGGVPISVVLVGAEGQNTDDWVNGVFKIAQAGITAYGGAPFPRYIFFFHCPENSLGKAGLEHLNCTVITIPLVSVRFAESIDLYLAAHEYTHAWNVKRIRPAALGPFDYTQPVRVKDLWWLEGGTDYLAPYLVVRAGLAGSDFWRGFMLKNINELESNEARKTVTLETASLKAWEGASEGFGGLSYYNKGMLVTLLLDIEMRHRTNNRVGVTDLLKALYKEATATGKGFSNGEVERMAGQLTKSDLSAFFNTALRTTNELPFTQILPFAGLTLNVKSTLLPYFGINWDFADSSDDGIRIGDVVAGGPAARAGFRKGDLITSVNGQSIAAAFGDLFQSSKPGDKVTLRITRDGATKTLPLTLGHREEKTYRLIRTVNPTPAQAALFAAISGASEKAK